MKNQFLIFLTLSLLTMPAFAQGRGGRGGGGGAPIGAIPANPGSQGNRPSDPGFFPEQRPVNPGPTTGPSIRDEHQPEASSHAVDPTDTHGFKNYGLYVAASHVSDKFDIPLSELQTEMNADGGNLGKAIHTLRPDLSSNEVDAEVKKAEAAAKKADAEAKKNRS